MVHSSMVIYLPLAEGVSRVNVDVDSYLEEFQTGRLISDVEVALIHIQVYAT